MKWGIWKDIVDPQRNLTIIWCSQIWWLFWIVEHLQLKNTCNSWDTQLSIKYLKNNNTSQVLVQYLSQPVTLPSKWEEHKEDIQMYWRFWYKICQYLQKNNKQIFYWADWSREYYPGMIDTKIEGFSIIDILSSEESTIQRKLQFKSHLSNLDAEQTQK